MNPIQIRQASITDHDQLTDFNLAMAKETENLTLDESTLRAGILAGLNNPDIAFYFVAELKGKIAGSLMITKEWSDWRNSFVWWIQSVYVLPQFRRQGIYRSLYDYVKDLSLQDKNCSGIRLYVDKTNLNAIKTYTNLGMNGEHYQLFEWMK
ncbi:MAG: GNAT family N-acetyltransferase [Bacteroidales bacterium]|nr:GNAT family N-acetyltransferase [Bacteroidales bacterium]